MKFNFKIQQYQTDAVDAVVRVFLRAVMKATGKEADVIYVVGGGSKNAIINQTCADDLGKKIVTCDMECSCVGVAAAQLAGICPEFSYGDLRKIIKASLKTNTYYPGKK